MGDDRLITPRQKQFIEALGGKWEPNMTVREASALIDELLKKRDNKILEEIVELCQRYANLHARIELLKDKITSSAVYSRESKLYEAIYKKIYSLSYKESKADAREFAKKFGITFL
jgi:phage gp36-like protein